MTLPETIAAAAPATPPERAVWRAEIIETIKLAWPIALTQLGQIAMMTTDLALIGRLGGFPGPAGSSRNLDRLLHRNRDIRCAAHLPVSRADVAAGRRRKDEGLIGPG